MKKEAAQIIVDAYTCAVKLACMDLQGVEYATADNLCDTLRDYIILMLSNEGNAHLVDWNKPYVTWTDGVANS